MNRFVLFLIFLVFLGLNHVLTIRADITLETQSKEYIFDTLVYEHQPNQNFGDGDLIAISTGVPSGIPSGQIQQSYLAFNIRQFLIDEGYSLENIQLNQVKIILTSYREQTDWSSPIEVRFPDSPWDENSLTWNNQPIQTDVEFTYEPSKHVGEKDTISTATILGLFQTYLTDKNEAWKKGILLTPPSTWINHVYGIVYSSSEHSDINQKPKIIITFSVIEPIPTPSSTPTITPIPTPTPSSTPTPQNFISLNAPSLEANQLVADPPAGFQKGKITFGSLPGGNGTDGTGMEITLAPGQGVWILSEKIIDAPSLVNISGFVRASNKSPAVALVALNSPIDGQLGYTNLAVEEIPVGDYRQLNLYYRPPAGKVQLAIQAVNYPFSTISSTIWVDSLDVNPVTAVVDGTPVSLQVDGSFEKGVENLILNMNGTDGQITPFFESLSDIAIRLTVQPDSLAANIGTVVQGIYDQFPLRLMGQASVKRDSIPGGGMLAFVMTNGYQNVGLFRYTDQIPGPADPEPEYLIVGSDFTVNNPDVPIYVVVQNGGPGADSSVVVDDLMLLKSSIEASRIPIGNTDQDTFPTPTPTPRIQLETIIVPIPNLPDGAKPLEMVLIQAGTFMMGSLYSEQDRNTDEAPQHQVTISQPFYIGKHEITQGQYQALIGDNPSYFQGINRPVERVNLNNCLKFIQELNILEIGTFRLPTEAEWEYACRAGTSTRFYWGDDTDYSQIEKYAWYKYNSNSQSHDVGTKLPNAWSLYDMSGNVFEWCQDWYAGYPDNSQTDPSGPSSGSHIVIRGGSWFYEPWGCRSAIRNWVTPSNIDNYGGFRVVMDK